MDLTDKKTIRRLLLLAFYVLGVAYSAYLALTTGFEAGIANLLVIGLLPMVSYAAYTSFFSIFARNWLDLAMKLGFFLFFFFYFFLLIQASDPKVLSGFGLLALAAFTLSAYDELTAAKDYAGKRTKDYDYAGKNEESERHGFALTGIIALSIFTFIAVLAGAWIHDTFFPKVGLVFMKWFVLGTSGLVMLASTYLETQVLLWLLGVVKKSP